MNGFPELQEVVEWVFKSITTFWSDGLMAMGIIGSFAIGMPILRKLVNVFRKIF